MIDGDPWFVATDVQRILGIKGDGWFATRGLDDDEKQNWDTPRQMRGRGIDPA